MAELGELKPVFKSKGVAQNQNLESDKLKHDGAEILWWQLRSSGDWCMGIGQGGQ